MKAVETVILVTVNLGLVKVTVKRKYKEAKRKTSNRSKKPQ